MSRRVTLRWNINKALVEFSTKAAARKGIWKACDHLLAESNKDVPLDHGPLMQSGKVSQSDDGKTGCVSYDTPYAVVQHENMQYQHQRGRKAKYLEDKLNDKQVQQNMRTLVASEFKGRM